MICCWIHIQAWIYYSSTAFHKALVLHGSLQYLQYAPSAEIRQIWYCRVQSPAVSKRQDVRWCNFHWSIPLPIDYVWESSIDKFIAISSCRLSYCLYDLIRLNSIVYHVHTTRYTIIQFSEIDADINWLCLRYVHWYGYFDSYILILHMK